MLSGEKRPTCGDTRRRSWRLRHLGIVALLAVALLAMSGCYAKVHFWGPPYTPGEKNITIKRGITDRIIWDCTVRYGTGSGRAFCALDTIHALCTGIELQNVIPDDCSDMGSYGHWESMASAIENVTGPNDDCLSFFNKGGDSFPDEFWGGVHLGFASCE
jgi:hypothetical protein